MSKTAYLNRTRLDDGRQISRNRKTKWVAQDGRIKVAQQQLTSMPPLLTTFEFLSKVTKRCPFNYLILEDGEEDEDVDDPDEPDDTEGRRL